jgi:hypothetical protein
VRIVRTFEPFPGQQLTGGSAGDMLSQMSYTQQAGGGYYSVYVGTVIDMAKILDSFHTAEFQYLPALAIPKDDTLALKLNNPPSFHKPQSVLVIGLPAVKTPELPVLHAVDAKAALCAQTKPLLLPVVGAPYVFATGYAHDFVLRLQNKAGQSVDLPAKPDALKGGFVGRCASVGGAEAGLQRDGNPARLLGFRPV